MSDIVKEILRVISSSLQIPTIIILILLILLTILMLGSFVAEIFTERKALKLNIPGLVDQLQGKNSTQMKEAIEASGLLNRQKESARELINRTSYNDDTREALARQLIADEDIRYSKIVKITDLVARVAPMFGLMGTLIPLGPGLIALGQGDTSTLSSSLLIAFDTTVAGLISGAISYVISGIRKNWYEEYMIGLETIMETILDVQSEERDATGRQLKQGAAVDGKAPAQPKAGAKATDSPAAPAKPGMPGAPGTGAAKKPGQAPMPSSTPINPATPAKPTVPGQPQRPQGRPVDPAGQARQATSEVMDLTDLVQDVNPQTVAPEIGGIAGGVQKPQPKPQAVRREPVSPRRETLTQPVQPAANVDPLNASRNTQMQPHAPKPNSKMDHTMVQRSFQEEVRAAEQAMLEAQRQAGQEGRQILHRPEGQ